MGVVMGDLDRFIDGLTSVDRGNLHRFLIALKPVILALELEPEGATEYMATLFTNLIEGVLIESERRAFNALTADET
jgi:hypothetical protein